MEIQLIDLYGAEDEETSEEKGSEEEGSEEGEPQARTIPADELEAMLARASGRGERKATKRLAKELGFDSVAAMKDFVAQEKQAADDAKTEEQKRLEEADKRERAAAAEEEKLRDERLMVKIERALVAEGVTEEKRLDRLATLVWSELEDELEEDEWAEAIDTAVTALKTDMAESFTGRKVTGTGDGGAEGPSTPGDETTKQEEGWEREYQKKGLTARLPS